ncbi:major allergen Pru ar 1-like [Andrographis paniculata]|uniref:major allergen Pru ar 1-like n=1 Tax=Andrographis paniculata TaxID=175694 RepID=UPI0021E7E68C|nr:major allergen Pru ar 1-like [Andrographis paniculata]
MCVDEGTQSKTLKVRVDHFDKDNLIYKSTLLGGEGFGDFLESVSRETKIEAKPDDGGSVVKIITTYRTKEEVTSEGKLKQLEASIKIGDRKTETTIKAVEAYLLANPNE